MEHKLSCIASAAVILNATQECETYHGGKVVFLAALYAIDSIHLDPVVRKVDNFIKRIKFARCPMKIKNAPILSVG